MNGLCKSAVYQSPLWLLIILAAVFIPERIRGELKGAFEKLTGGELVPVEYYENPVLTRNDEERMG